MVKFSLLGLSLLMASTAFAKELPQWEAGAGLFGVSIPYYRGAAEGYRFPFAYPVIRYRGEKYSVDSRDSAKRWFFVSDRYKLHLSLAWGLPVFDGAKEREGMEHLPSLIELGPKLAIKIAELGNQTLAFKVPLRVGISVDLESVAYQGWVTAPYLHYLYQTWGKNRWKLAYAMGVRYSNQGYQDFYYGTPAEFGGYRASGGYGGWWHSAAVYKTLGKFELSVYGRYDFLDFTSFEDSPLVSRKRYFAAGLNIVWWFAQSSIAVVVDDKETF